MLSIMAGQNQRVVIMGSRVIGSGVQDAVEEEVSASIHGLHVSDATLSEMQAKHVRFIPTLQAFRSIGRRSGSTAAKNNLERAVDGHTATVCRAYEKGVTVLLGSDAGPHSFLIAYLFIEEWRLMIGVGISNDDAIRTACIGPLERSPQADLTVLDGLTISQVIKRGKFLHAEPARII